MSGYIGFGWCPRCPNCGATVAHGDQREGMAGIYPCGTCGAVHERDESGRLVEADASERGAAMTTLPVAPVRSHDQRMAALALANDTRYRRAALKRDLRAGRVRLDDLLLEPPEWLKTARVFDLLLAVPRIGDTKATAAFAKASISPMKTVAGMSSRQRDAIVALIRRPPPRRRTA